MRLGDRRQPRWIAAAILALLCVVATTVAAGAAPTDRRIVRPSPLLDTNGNRFHDLLEQHLGDGSFKRFESTVQSASATGALADLIVCLDHAPTAADVAAVRAAGGTVAWSMGDLPDSLLFAMRVGWPVAQGAAPALQQLEHAVPGIVWVDETPVAQQTMFYSTRQTGARRAWATTGLRGRSDRTVVIMDTGLDDSHPDLAGRIVGWIDETTDAAPTPRDPQHHGSHVAGTAVGSGAAAGIASGTGQLYISSTANFSTTANFGPVITFPVDTTGYGSPAPIQIQLKWTNTAGAGNVNLYLGRWDGSNITVTASISAAMTDPQPLILNSTIPTSEMRPDWAVLITRDVSGDTSKFWVQRRTPVTSAGDGHNLNSGIAPESSLAGVRIFRDNGAGDGDTLAGFQWISDNRVALGIVAVNNSWTFGAHVPSVDTAVNNLVANGVVIEVSAGNSRGGGTVESPAVASAAIATAALNAIDQNSYYSSPGFVGQSKPDISAPGGSVQPYNGFGNGRVIESVDSNDADEQNVAPDQFANDYRGFQGTSMAGPHVTGACALVAQAIEATFGPWSWTSPQSAGFANRVKMLLGMTATETNAAAEVPPNPTLDRGAKDISEGFGRMNVDAAVETVLYEYSLGLTVGATFGSDPFDRKAWGRRVYLTGLVPQTFTLTVPGGADYDLYLYRDAWTNDGSTEDGSIGDPIIAVKSTSAALGGTEAVTFTPTTTGLYYVVVKRVAGAGAFSLDSAPPTFTCGGPVLGALAALVTPTLSALPGRTAAAMPTRTTAVLPARQCGG